MSLTEAQKNFIEKVLAAIPRVVKACAEQGGKAALVLGRKKVGGHTIRVSVVAEREASFKAPLQNYSIPHAESGSTDVVKHTQTNDTIHRNHKRSSQLQKKVF